MELGFCRNLKMHMYEVKPEIIKDKSQNCGIYTKVDVFAPLLSGFIKTTDVTCNPCAAECVSGFVGQSAVDNRSCGMCSNQ